MRKHPIYSIPPGKMATDLTINTQLMFGNTTFSFQVNP